MNPRSETKFFYIRIICLRFRQLNSKINCKCNRIVNHGILHLGMMMVKLVDDKTKTSVVLVIAFLYCPKAGGSFLSECKLISLNVDFRRVEGRPYIYFGDKREYRMSLIQHTQTPLFPNDYVVNPFDPDGNADTVSNFVVRGHVHSDFVYIKNRNLLESAEHGTI
ncbi:unnamed protein product [Ambrosiozyma monospora]|uniref:Unnamed protein product n=1 Tax=Ambrosiozyma monospora TaxID=43982 RepID=A0A9W7DDS5_AMBMO|nr:unnamed protein product [Ambrosiozyma monospora]